MLTELQALLSHQVPDGDAAVIVERALAALLVQAKKQRAAATNRPQKRRTKEPEPHEGDYAAQAQERSRAVPAAVRREVFERDEGSCTFVDDRGRQCGSTWQIELHHRLPFAKAGVHTVDNLELRHKPRLRTSPDYTSATEGSRPGRDPTMKLVISADTTSVGTNPAAYPDTVFVQLALQEELDKAGVKMNVKVEAA